MDAPPVQYVTTSDDYKIAYATRGEGTPVILLPGTFDHVQLAWQYPGLQEWVEGLSSKFRLVQFDPRGTGMSQRGLKKSHVRLDYQNDLDAVIDALRLQRFILLGFSNGVARIVEYSLRKPERVIALIVGTSGLPRSRALFRTVPAEDWDAFLWSLVPRDMSREEAERRVAMQKAAHDQQDFILRQSQETEASTELLKAVRVPALVLHARNYALTPIEEGMKKAQLLDALLVVMDGTSALGDANQGIAAVENFLGSLRSDAQTGTNESLGLLSSRELEVLKLIAAGRSNRHVADELNITASTATRHVSNILRKTGAINRTEAAAYAHRHGLA
jgi:pimeloyl-ACP methyl ester carboxylesterase/DNA-binding CsgD family transcriptional regulator